MKLLRQFLAALLLCSLIACHGNNSADTAQTEGLNKTVSASKAANKLEGDQFTATADSTAPQQNQVKQLPPGKSQTKEDWDKKIVKTGDLVMEVKSYKTFNDLLHS